MLLGFGIKDLIDILLVALMLFYFYKLMKGAHILRVHDVKAAREAILITEKLKAMSEFSESSEPSEKPTHNS